MSKKTVILGLLLLCSGGAVAAANGMYVGAQYALTTYSNATGSTDADMGVLMLRGGLDITPHVGVEGRFGIGISDDTAGVSTLETDSILGIYVKGQWPLNDRFTVYGLLGFSQVDMTLTVGSVGTVVADDTDTSYGLGARLAFDERWSGHVEYMNYYDKGVEEVTALGIGVEYRF